MGRRSTSLTTSSKDQTRAAMERMEAERMARRQALVDLKCQRADEEKRIRDAGNSGDVDFVGLVQRWRYSQGGITLPYNYSASKRGREDIHSKICISVRKRPINTKEISRKEHDSVTVMNPTVWVHVPKHRVDGINKYLDHSSFCFDFAFDENSVTQDIYAHTALPLVQNVVKGNGCRATVFAYGQTGSGKTHTMSGIQVMVAADLFSLLHGELGLDNPLQQPQPGESAIRAACTGNNTSVTLSFFEIYGVRIQDLLNNRHQLKVLEDGRGEVVIFGLEEYEVNDAEQLLSYIAQGNGKRTTHSTEANDTSSRSHSICQIMLRDKESKRLRGKLSLVDLAGSERGVDTKSHDRQRQSESSEINKSLLSLKECIRALDTSSAHVSYRASKLTLVLKDCFTSSRAQTTMIATVSPASSSVDHTLNTLRYADRVKEKKVVGDFLPKAVMASKKTTPCAVKHEEATIIDTTADEGANQHFEPEHDMLCHVMHFKNPYENERLASESVEEYRSESHGKKAMVEARRPQKIMTDEDFPFQTGQQQLLAEVEQLVNLHMNTIQEHANLLTEEGTMLQEFQKDDVLGVEMDDYASRLSSILDHKTRFIAILQDKIEHLRFHLH